MLLLCWRSLSCLCDAVALLEEPQLCVMMSCGADAAGGVASPVAQVKKICDNREPQTGSDPLPLQTSRLSDPQELRNQNFR
ncbi:hypothetical protein NQZ68_040577 [Dissostichus eleginoides]|nr:hypothetical protein NQZ68_040577 [Dissostichus eleginoides]